MTRAKVCTGPCGLLKTLDQYHRKADMADGRQSRCKVCSLRTVVAWQREHRRTDPEYREADRARALAYYRANRDRCIEASRAAYRRRQLAKELETA